MKYQSSILGWIDRSSRRHYFFLQPFQKDYPANIFIRKDEIKKHDASLHTIVRATLSRKKSKEYEATIEETFSSLDDPRLELAIVQEKNGFSIEFSQQALQDAHSQENKKPGKRIDLTRSVIVTIDGETAKDFDDAITVEKTSDGNYNLKVSIADVSHFVQEGSQLDKEAYARGTSIYFPGYAIPMLPEHLSNHLCSLVPHQPRYTLTADIILSKKGEILESSIYPSIIKSHARLTYTTVAKVIEGGETDLVEPRVAEMLKTAHELSLIVRSNRKLRGGLDLDLPETEIEVNDAGDVLRIYRSERNEAHKLIEDFMILANEVVSEEIEKKGFASIFRVHEQPDPLKIDRLRRLVRRWGFAISEKRDLVDSLQRYLESVRGHQNEKTLIVSLLRSLKQAEYAATNVGHFGLGSESYCHFTSPIRRYPDLMIHRILRNTQFLQSKNSPYPFEKLAVISKSCSETERRAFLSERDMEDLKKCRYMASYVGETFDATVTSIKSFGIFVEIHPHFVEGLIPMRYLPHDFWEVDDLETCLRGRRSRTEFWLGDPIRVTLVEVDRLKTQISLKYVAHAQSTSKPTTSPSRRELKRMKRNLK